MLVLWLLYCRTRNGVFPSPITLPFLVYYNPQVTCSDWTMIPAENLVSVAMGTPTKIAVQVGIVDVQLVRRKGGS